MADYTGAPPGGAYQYTDPQAAYQQQAGQAAAAAGYQQAAYAYAGYADQAQYNYQSVSYYSFHVLKLSI